MGIVFRFAETIVRFANLLSFLLWMSQVHYQPHIRQTDRPTTTQNSAEAANTVSQALRFRLLLRSTLMVLSPKSGCTDNLVAIVFDNHSH
jgi:hypothetical protein